VTDFGLALALDTLELGARVPSAGTPAYMAPERAVGQPLAPEHAHRVDVYALGILATQLLTGKLPFEDTNLQRLISRHITDPPPRPSELKAGLSAAFDAPILAALEKRPEDRLDSAEEFRTLMLAAREEGAPEDRETRVLVADDDEDFRKLTRLWMRRAFPKGEVVEAANGREALEALSRERFSLVILDLQMPDVDGIEVTRMIRSAERNQHVPILVITGHGGATDWRKLSELGADGFVVKPVDGETLIQTVRRLVSD
jgi:serine/threonine-protein kinase